MLQSKSSNQFHGTAGHVKEIVMGAPNYARSADVGENNGKTIVDVRVSQQKTNDRYDDTFSMHFEVELPNHANTEDIQACMNYIRGEIRHWTFKTPEGDQHPQ